MRKFIIILILIYALLMMGCIRTRIVINSDPPRSKVSFDDVYRGKTPIEIPLLFFWYHKIKVEQEGYKTIEKIERFYAPPWFYVPLDLIMEIMPFPIYKTYNKFYMLEKSEE